MKNKGLGIGVLLIVKRALSVTLLLRLALLPGTAGAEDLNVHYVPADVRFEFDSSLPAGIERRRFTEDIRLRGWRVADRIYFGQAKVADEWGVGFVFQNGNTVYGLNNRGIQITRQF